MTAVRKHVTSLSKLQSISLALYLATFAFVMLKDPVLGNDSFSYNVMEINYGHVSTLLKTPNITNL